MNPMHHQHRQPQASRLCGWWVCLVALIALVAMASGAELTGLVLSNSTLTPAFDRTITSYTAQVPNAATYTNLLLDRADTDKVKVNGVLVNPRGYSLPLQVGANVATVVVTAANGQGAKTYRIVIVRAGPPRITVEREAGKPLELLSSAVAWGANSYHHESTLPRGLDHVVAFASGLQHSVALKSNGTVVPWGDEQYAQPDVAKRLGGIKAITAGDAWTVGLKHNGTLVMWGTENFGIRAGIRGLTGVRAISANTACLMVLKTNGTVLVRGTNQFGQRNVPPGLSGVKAIAAGFYHCVALKNDGTVVAWGQSWDEGTYVPQGLTGVREIAAGGFRTLALKEDGTVVIWGSLPSDQPAVPEGLRDVKAIGAGWGYNVALKNDGSVVAWGRDRYGETILPESMPHVDSIWPGSYHCFALTSHTAPQVLGSVTIATIGTPVPFTIKNPGAGDLVLGKLTVTGKNADQFVISQPENSTIPPGGSTTFTVVYAPKARGSPSATIHIPSNDSEHSLFELVVVGLGACPQITIINPEVSHAITGQPFSQSFIQTGAIGPVTYWAVNALPPGLSLSPSGVLSGTANGSGSFYLTVQAIDSVGCTGWSSSYKLDMAERASPEDTPSEVVPFTDHLENTVLTVTSSNPRLVPVTNIVIEGTGRDRTLRFTPEPNQNGFVLITVTMTSGDISVK
ncbi:MAG: hypothetical protein JWO08_1976, partial [Verrucomicrobiaceae bacterium]|nr:hypothetical protein [Verrucomicrobiaceae bacterium]